MTQLTAHAAPTRPRARHAPLRAVGPPPLGAEPGVRFALVHVALVGATLVSGVLTWSGPVRLDVLGVVVVVAAWVLPLRPGLAVALSAWALWTGFVEHRAGQLTLAPADLGRLALLLAAAATAACGAWWTARRRG